MASSNMTVIYSLQAAANGINLYGGMIIFVIGTVGNFLNILVLSQHTLRINPCAFYFLGSSVANLIAIFFGLITRVLAGGGADVADTIRWVCKVRAFILFSSRTASFWLIALATFDRWLVSCINVRLRQFSTLKNAKRGTLVISILSILLYFQTILCYEPNLINTLLPCYGSTLPCQIVMDVSYALMTVVLPLACMIIFGLMTICNVRQSEIRVNGTSLQGDGQTAPSDGRGQSSKKTDKQLLIMLLAQVVVLSILIFPQGFEKLYTTIIVSDTKPIYEREIYDFVYNIFLLLSFMANGLSFYLFTLTGGTVFRKAVRKVFMVALQKIKCDR